MPLPARIRAHPLIAALAGAILLLLGGLLIRSALRPPDTRTARQHNLTTTLDRLTGFADLEDPSAVRAALGAMVYEDPFGTSPAQRSALLEEIETFLRLRFREPTLDAYKRWRLDAGYVWQSLDTLDRLSSIRAQYEQRFGGPVPNGATAADLFDAFSGAERPDRVPRIAAIASEPRALLSRFGVATPGNPSDPALDGELGIEIWHGQGGAHSRHWLVWPRSRIELTKEHKRLGVACTGIVLEFADGSRRPMILRHLWEPRAGRWILDHCSFRGVAPIDPSLCEY